MLSLSVKMVGPFITSSQNQIGSLSDIRSSGGWLYPKSTYSSSEFFALILHQTIGESAIIYSSQLSQFFALYFSFPKVRKWLQHISSQVRLLLKMITNFDVLTRDLSLKIFVWVIHTLKAKYLYLLSGWCFLFCQDEGPWRCLLVYYFVCRELCIVDSPHLQGLLNILL